MWKETNDNKELSSRCNKRKQHWRRTPLAMVPDKTAMRQLMNEVERRVCKVRGTRHLRQACAGSAARLKERDSLIEEHIPERTYFDVDK